MIEWCAKHINRRATFLDVRLGIRGNAQCTAPGRRCCSGTLLPDRRIGPLKPPWRTQSSQFQLADSGVDPAPAESTRLAGYAIGARAVYGGPRYPPNSGRAMTCSQLSRLGSDGPARLGTATFNYAMYIVIDPRAICYRKQRRFRVGLWAEPHQPRRLLPRSNRRLGCSSTCAVTCLSPSATKQHGVPYRSGSFRQFSATRNENAGPRWTASTLNRQLSASVPSL